MASLGTNYLPKQFAFLPAQFFLLPFLSASNPQVWNCQTDPVKSKYSYVTLGSVIILPEGRGVQIIPPYRNEVIIPHQALHNTIGIQNTEGRILPRASLPRVKDWSSPLSPDNPALQAALTTLAKALLGMGYGPGLRKPNRHLILQSGSLIPGRSGAGQKATWPHFPRQ